MLIQLVVVLIIVAVLVALFIMGYVKAPSDQAIIITGVRKEPKIIIGKSSLKIPFLQRADRLQLRMLSVDVKTEKTIPTLDYINIMVDSVAVVKISSKPEFISRAAENFLNKDSAYINEMVVSVLEGNLREIIGSMNLVDIMNDRKQFADRVQQNATPDMAKMGLEIVSFNIQNIDDHGLGVIDNLGIANTTAIRKTAEVSRANAEKEIAVAQAKADREANAERVAADTAIAERGNELAIRKAELKAAADQKQADADAAYKIQEQIRQKDIQTATVEVEIAKAEKETELKEKQIVIRQKELAATVEREADASRYRTETEAAARLEQEKREAEAKKYMAEQEAAGIRAKYEAEAAGIAAKGKAEAEAVRAKGLAEAEAMDKKAEAYRKYNSAAVIEMLVNVLPQVAEAISAPLSSIDNVSIYGTGNGENGIAGISGTAPVVIQQVFDTMKQATGVDLAEIMRAETYDARVTKNVNVTGVPEELSVSLKKDSEP